MKKTYVFREVWPYHFDPLFDWISALPICSSAKILLARLHNSNRTLERVKRGEVGPFTFPWELQEIARTFSRANSAVTKWRAELEVLRSGQLRLGLVDASRAGVLPRDALHPFH